MKLRELAAAAPNLIGVCGDVDVEIRSLCADTRRTADLCGSLFFCISGANFDGNKFAKKAAEGGAVALRWKSCCRKWSCRRSRYITSA